jgi:hypothetical protein
MAHKLYLVIMSGSTVREIPVAKAKVNETGNSDNNRIRFYGDDEYGDTIVSGNCNAGIVYVELREVPAEPVPDST